METLTMLSYMKERKQEENRNIERIKQQSKRK